MSESGICSLETQMHVANCVINRVISNDYPNNLHEVIYQKSQFHPVLNGSLFRDEPSESVKEAVQIALRHDTINGALSFLNIELTIEMGYEENVKKMLYWNDIVTKSGQVTFLRPKKSKGD